VDKELEHDKDKKYQTQEKWNYMRDFIHSKGNKHIWIPLMQEFWIQNKPGEQSQKILSREKLFTIKELSLHNVVHNHCLTPTTIPSYY